MVNNIVSHEWNKRVFKFRGVYRLYHEITKYSFMISLVVDRLSVKSPPKKVKKVHIKIENQHSLVQRAALTTYLSKITISG